MLIGITGSLGSGKTTVARIFGRLGAYVIDADEVCHSLMKPSRQAYKSIVRHFGITILNKNKWIDRRRLSRIVFKDKARLDSLNKIIHPLAIKEIERICRAEKKRRFIVVDAPLLVESGFYKKMDKLIVVKNSIDNQIERLTGSKRISKKEALERIRMQAPLKEKAALADFIIDNSTSKTKTFSQVKKIWKKLRGEK